MNLLLIHVVCSICIETLNFREVADITLTDFYFTAVSFDVFLKRRDRLQDRHRLWDQLMMDLREKGLRVT